MENEKRTKFFRLSLVDDLTHSQRWVLRFTRGSFALLVLSVLLVLLVGCFLLVAYTPLRNIVPAQQETVSRHQAIKDAMRLDSLEAAIVQWELYSENLKRVLKGEEPVRLDSLVRLGNARRSQTMTPEMRRQDSLLRNLVREEEQFQVGNAVRHLSIEGLSFFTPVKGTVTEAFDRNLHPSLGITAPARSVVKAVLDGTVIFSEWREDAGYTVGIQHADDLVSIYRNCQNLMKKTGERVTAGTAIGVLDGGPEGKEGTLGLELWYRGAAVDPSSYIVF